MRSYRSYFVPFLVALFFATAVPLSTEAATVPFTGTLTVKYQGFTPIVIPGSGNVTVNGAGPLGFPISQLTIPAGAFVKALSTATPATWTAYQKLASFPCFGAGIGTVGTCGGSLPGIPTIVTCDIAGGYCASNVHPAPLYGLYLGVSNATVAVSLGGLCDGGNAPLVNCFNTQSQYAYWHLGGFGPINGSIKACAFGYCTGTPLYSPVAPLHIGGTSTVVTPSFGILGPMQQLAAGWRAHQVHALASFHNSPYLSAVGDQTSYTATSSTTLVVSLVSPMMIYFPGFPGTPLDIPGVAIIDLTIACGNTCGNNVAEACEVCDGTDVGACASGVCDADCTCTDANEPNETKETATPIALCPATPVQTEIDPLNDIDFYVIEGEAGATLEIDIDAVEKGGSTLDSQIAVFDSGGVELDASDNTIAPGESFSTDSFISLVLPATDIYYIAVGAWNDDEFDGTGGISTGFYEMTVTGCAGCGDGLILPTFGEVCDDGNTADGDCCLSDCQLPTGCLTGAKASLQVKEKGDKDQIKWKLGKGGVLGQADLGTPTTTTAYTLCIYDETGDVPALATSLTVAADATKWKDKDPKGFQYKDKAGASDGVTKVQFKTATVAGKSKAQFQAKGANVPTPTPISASEFFDQDTNVTVYLVNDANDTCWQSDFATNKKNTADQFKAKAP